MPAGVQVVSRHLLFVDDLHQDSSEREGRMPDEATRRLIETIPRAWNDRDWEVIASTLSADHRFVDHRAASAGDLVGRDDLVRYVQTLVEVAPDAAYRFVEIHRLGPFGAVAQWHISGSNEGGGPVELEGVLAAEVREGVIVRTDQYDVERLDDAIARFESFSG